MTGSLRASVALWRQMVRTAPAHCSVAAGLTLVRAAATVGYVVGVARLVDNVTRSSEAPLIPVLVTFASWAVAQISDTARGAVVPEIQARWTVALTQTVLDRVVGDQTLTGSTDTARRAASSALDGVRSWMGMSAIPALWYALDSRVVGLLGVVVVGWWSPLAGLCLAAAQLATSATFTRYLDAVHRDLRAADTPDRVRTRYYRDLLLHPEPAKEVRLFGLAPWLLYRHHQAWLTGIRAVWQRRDRAARPSHASLAFLALVTAATLAAMSRSALNGSLSAGGVAATIQGLMLSVGLGMLGDTLVQVRRAVNVQAAVDALATEVGSHANGRSSGPNEPVLVPAGGVDIHRLAFSYGHGAPVLEDFNLRIDPGEKVAIVGPNGAGKSTLVRLIAGLEVADHGSVLVDGVATTALPPDVRPAVVFQTFAHLPASMSDNVLLGRSLNGHRPDGYAQALRRGGADQLDVDYHQLLSSHLPGGRDLSGGEWQRVALARAFAAVAQGAPLLVLDEPTSALDVRVEHDLFQRVLSTESHVTTILVTHRLASVRRADRIVVVDSGQVRECGTHEELMAASGLYAEMFKLQASLYAEDGITDE